MKTFRPLVLSASILILGAGGMAQAQPAPPPPGGMMAGVRDDAGHGPRHEHRDPAEMARRHADHLRAALQLTPAQEPALAAFLSAMKPPEGARDRMRGERQEMAGLTTPQRLDRARARMDEHRALMDQRFAAVKRFYAQLTPAQQKAFDALHQDRGGHMGGHMGGHGMGPRDRG